MTLRPSSPVPPPAVPPGDESPSFRVRLDLVDGRVELAGRLDRRSAHLFGDAVSALLLTGRERWAVDMSQLTGCDQAGLRMIGAAYRRALRHGRRLTLLGAPPELQQALVRLRLHAHVVDPAERLPA